MLLYNKINKEFKKFLLDKKFRKFLLVGVVNTIFGYSLYALFLSLGFHYNIAVLFSTILGILFNFKTIGKFVFNKSSNQFFLKFVSSYVIIYFLNITLLSIFDYFGFNMYLAGLIAIICLAFVSFYLNKKFVFNHN